MKRFVRYGVFTLAPELVDVGCRVPVGPGMDAVTLTHTDGRTERVQIASSTITSSAAAHRDARDDYPSPGQFYVMRSGDTVSLLRRAVLESMTARTLPRLIRPGSLRLAGARQAVQWPASCGTIPDGRIDGD